MLKNKKWATWWWPSTAFSSRARPRKCRRSSTASKKGREFVVVVRHKGATSDGTDMSKLEPSNSDPPATEGANKPACCSIL